MIGWWVRLACKKGAAILPMAAGPGRGAAWGRFSAFVAETSGAMSALCGMIYSDSMSGVALRPGRCNEADGRKARLGRQIRPRFCNARLRNNPSGTRGGWAVRRPQTGGFDAAPQAWGCRPRVAKLGAGEPINERRCRIKLERGETQPLGGCLGRLFSRRGCCDATKNRVYAR